MVAHVFVDAENISPAVTFKVVEHFGKAHTVTKVDIIAKEDSLPFRYRDLDEKLYRVQNCFYGKNSADTWLCIEIVRAIIDEPDLELIIIVSGDKDFLPAIKFAVDFEKKVVVVSNGAGHKTLTEQLRALHVSPDAVELKDYRLHFGDPTPGLEKFLPQMSFFLKKYFFDREERIKFILVKKGAQLVEVPFIRGMGSGIFRRLLIDLNVISKGDSVKDFITHNFLKLAHDRVFFRSEAELAVPTPAEQVETFFADNADAVRKIFVKHNGKLSEVPFVDGMPLGLFGQMLREKKIIGKGATVSAVATNSLLDVRDDKVFLNDEDALERIVNAVDEYLDRHAAQLTSVFIKHNGELYEVPFVDGMPLELFAKLLRDMNIIGKNALPATVAANSLLDVRDDKVFLRDEDDLDAAYERTISDADEYFDFHADKLTSVLIKHNGELSEVPFVNGMPLELFGKLLREMHIIDRKTAPAVVAARSGLDVRDGKVFMQAATFTTLTNKNFGVK